MSKQPVTFQPVPSSPLNPKDLIGRRKPSLTFLPFRVLYEIGSGLAEGARKYGPFNWRSGPKLLMSTYVDATMRHLSAFWEGENIDPDSELSHITKAITSLVVLRDAMLAGQAHDDRPPAVPQGWMNNIKVQEAVTPQVKPSK
jgi:hypothetical protein